MVAALLGSAGVRAAPGPRVRVISTTDQPLVQPQIDDFERRHAGTRVDYLQYGSIELVERFLADGGRSADVLWSSAMDQQIKLVNDGHSARHASAQAARLPRWAVWKQEAHGSTFEPVRESSSECPRIASQLASAMTTKAAANSPVTRRGLMRGSRPRPCAGAARRTRERPARRRAARRRC